MALPTAGDIPRLGDSQLRQEVEKAREEVRELAAAPDPGQPDERERNLRRMRARSSFALSAEKELAGRESRRVGDAIKAQATKRWLASGGAAERPAEAALTMLRKNLPPPLVMEDMDATRLSKKEAAEFFELTKASFAGQITAEQLPRYEALLEKLADRPGAIELTRNPPRPPAPTMLVPTVSLPSYLLGWAMDREGGLDTFRLGVLWQVVAGLKNRQPVLIGSRIEEQDGEVVLVGASEPLRLDPGDGSLATTKALAYLHRQELLTLERTNELRVGLGPKLKKFYNAPEGGDNDGR